MSLTIQTFSNLNIITKYGDDINIEFTRQNSSGQTVNNSAFDYQTEIQVSQGGAILLTYNTNGNASGVWELNIPRADITSELIINKTYYYEVTETNASSKKQCLIQGYITLQSK